MRKVGDDGEESRMREIMYIDVNKNILTKSSDELLYSVENWENHKLIPILGESYDLT